MLLCKKLFLEITSLLLLSKVRTSNKNLPIYSFLEDVMEEPLELLKKSSWIPSNRYSRWCPVSDQVCLPGQTAQLQRLAQSDSDFKLCVIACFRKLDHTHNLSVNKLGNQTLAQWYTMIYNKRISWVLSDMVTSRVHVVICLIVVELHSDYMVKALVTELSYHDWLLRMVRKRSGTYLIYTIDYEPLSNAIESEGKPLPSLYFSACHDSSVG